MGTVYIHMQSSCLNCSDYVFTRNLSGVSGSGIPVRNVLLDSNMAPMCVDNTYSAPEDGRVSGLFKGDIGVPLGLLVIGSYERPSIQLSGGKDEVVPAPLMDQLIDLLQPRSGVKTRKRKPKSSYFRNTRISIY